VPLHRHTAILVVTRDRASWCLHCRAADPLPAATTRAYDFSPHLRQSAPVQSEPCPQNREIELTRLRHFPAFIDKNQHRQHGQPCSSKATERNHNRALLFLRKCGFRHGRSRKIKENFQKRISAGVLPAPVPAIHSQSLLTRVLPNGTECPVKHNLLEETRDSYPDCRSCSRASNCSSSYPDRASGRRVVSPAYSVRL
jgi:hypothetical protein